MYYKMTEREYRRLRAQIQRKYEDDLAALDRVWKLSQSDRSTQGGRAGRMSKGAVLGGVREAVRAMSGTFTLRDIEAWVRSNKPELSATARTTISGTLKRMVGREIEVVREGAGKRPTSYKKVQVIGARVVG